LNPPELEEREREREREQGRKGNWITEISMDEGAEGETR
jgi:hypothetical protein